MNIIIVGHGPSLIGKKLGSQIDGYDLVVRLKGCSGVLGTEDYGKRADILCMSTEAVNLAFTVNTEGYWLYPKKGRYDTSVIGTFLGDIGRPVLLPLGLMNTWNETFRGMGGKHPNVSTGMAAIIIAAYHMNPSEIILAGFDTLTNPDVPFSRNDAIPRTGVGVIDHDWKKENELLKIVSESLSVRISKL